MTRNHKRIPAVAGILVISVGTFVAKYSPESNFTLSPGFSIKEENGYIHVEENQVYEDFCKYTINEKPNHTGTLTDDFNNSIIKIKVTVDSDNSDPFIIIKSPDKQIRPICENDQRGTTEELTFFSYDYTYNIEPGSYQVWIGDQQINDESVEYTIVIEEEEEF